VQPALAGFASQESAAAFGAPISCFGRSYPRFGRADRMIEKCGVSVPNSRHPGIIVVRS
jgi:hypothetical protein